MRVLSSWRLAAAGLVLAMQSLVGCGDKEVEVAPVVYTGPLAETTNVETLVSDSARLQLRLTAPLEQQFENGDVVYPKSVKAVFYDKLGKSVASTLEANYAKVEKSTQLYTMRGKVRMVSVPEQQTVTSEEVFYDKLKHRIYTDTAMFVRVQSPTQVLLGYGLVANEDLSRYTVKRPTGIFTLEEAKAQGK
ncbi:LPS export ABC transporter periplasmic protein LptC [Hymenobacter setariae]|uniref:LPS export ABC transporter periplasmic protein LptC n=1 Tax=Hymenobacter setariae TaxID=2594794 RepID=A0A558BXM2_9BACT|nr:LPS export ABC transporter periplasmic protein LptC [Hymenobacter setariae]TVT41242.1 LPS export ABC transporter periplasmic protein LptC [Hymenobacter setariae]